MRVRIERTRPWPSCRRYGLGIVAERLAMGTVVGDPRPRTLYKLEVEILVRRLVVSIGP